MVDAPPPYPGENKAPYPPGSGQPPMAGMPPQQGYQPVPQPQAGYQPQYQPGYAPQPGATVVVTQPTTTVVVRQTFNQYPVSMTCPHCSAQISTGVTYETSGFTWLICFLLCIIGCDLGCCFIPFCVDSCKDAIHSCPNCRQVVGHYKRL